ncbi:nuclear transport factor 2 family protein [Streptomyces montanus]|uniref:Nuclear transport factor 2 family protein n=1 Tax=Streptomyces montanus TaxID=2580423 RepID=A0A5R9FZ24_9ACTN|nr:nuclear transport factor 2 family protein [Streptomyces montanus]TLS47170.1 nuclear transport factor 2 family protein [Streptomyces montanus]
MGTTSGPGFDTDTLRQGVEGQNPETLLSLYADDAELRIVDRNTQPSHPKVMHGREQISEMLNDVYSRDMTHKLEQCIVQGDQAAFTEFCEYPDGVKVLATSTLALRDGKIVDQILLQEWDDEP